MRKSKFLALVCTLAGTVAVVAANISVSSCLILWAHQPKCPESLLK